MANWYRQWEQSQALVILPLVLIIAGGAGLILGSGAARSFGHLGGSPAVRTASVAMCAGGIAVLYGLRFHHILTVVSGMAVSALGSALYGVGTLIGFGTGGIMSGVLSLGVSAVFLERVWFTLVRSRARRRIEDDQATDPS